MTSISDTDRYKEVCEEFVNNDELFLNFKQDPIYTEILEHTSRGQALQYINYIVNSRLDLTKISKLRENDEQGNPIKCSYDNGIFDDISPSTIRYIKVLSEIKDIFTHLNGKDIIEIGVGYGGQCKVIMDYFEVNSYQLVDLDIVLKLSEKYLSKYNYKNVYYGRKYLDKYDLVISNYAITECNKKTQIDYIDNIINISNHGYITCNYISDIFNIESLGKDEFISKINKEVFIQPETPLSHPNNFLLIW
jgi:hypothetical protein